MPSRSTPSTRPGHGGAGAAAGGAALAEIARVLRPGGRFFFEEVTATALARPSCRALSGHPAEGRFTAGEFLAGCGRHGLDPGERRVTRADGDCLFGVACRGGPEAL